MARRIVTIHGGTIREITFRPINAASSGDALSDDDRFDQQKERRLRLPRGVTGVQSSTRAAPQNWAAHPGGRMPRYLKLFLAFAGEANRALKVRSCSWGGRAQALGLISRRGDENIKSKMILFL
jgi:hypothetical protein